MMEPRIAMGAVIAMITILDLGSNNAIAQNTFNEADFKVKDFGVKDGIPWLTVEGKAGG
jgi:hypothetical protein